MNCRVLICAHRRGRGCVCVGGWGGGEACRVQGGGAEAGAGGRGGRGCDAQGGQVWAGGQGGGGGDAEEEREKIYRAVRRASLRLTDSFVALWLILLLRCDWLFCCVVTDPFIAYDWFLYCVWMRPLRMAALLVNALLRLVACLALHLSASYCVSLRIIASRCVLLRLAASYRGVSPRLVASRRVLLRLVAPVASRRVSPRRIAARLFRPERLLEHVGAGAAGRYSAGVAGRNRYRYDAAAGRHGRASC